MANGAIDTVGSVTLVALGSKNLVLGTDGAGVVTFLQNKARVWQINSTGLTFSNEITIGADTADGADTKSVAISGGGGTGGGSRGGTLFLYGNEHASLAGQVFLQGGSVTTGHVLVRSTNASAEVRLQTNSSTRFAVISADLVQDATNGGNILLTKASSFVAQPAATTISAAGSAIGDATQLAATFNNITTVAASTGVKLYDSTSNGYCIAVRNSGANNLNVYPPNASGTINGGSAGAAVVVATTEVAVFFKVAANTWIGGVMVVF